MKKAMESGKGSSTTSHASVNGMRRELMRLPNSHQTDSSNQYAARDNDDFILSESDRQTLLIKYFPSSPSLSHAFRAGFCMSFVPLWQNTMFFN